MGGRGKGKGGERGEDVEGPGKWSAPGPVLALGGPDCRLTLMALRYGSHSFTCKLHHTDPHKRSPDGATTDYLADI